MNFASKLLLTASLAFASLSASASLTPVYDTFGTLAAANFGGTGISNKAVAIDTFTGKNIIGQSTGTITLGLTVTARYANQTVTNNGAGVFYAAAGVDQTNASSISQELATWNIDYYIGGATSSNLYVYTLLFDIDPSVNENFKSITLGANTQNSTNLGFDLAEFFYGYSFDPALSGQYGFILQASNIFTGSVVGMTSILLNVGSNKVPEPTSLALMALGLIGVAAVSRRRKV